jgi:predicted acyl esterase
MPSKERLGSWHAYDVVVERDTMIPGCDGVRLATDIYFPSLGGVRAAGRFPALVERTPYDKDAARFVLPARFFAQHGHVVLMQDVRGRGHSEGEWYPFAHEAPDCYDTIEWAAAQPWCTGKVGTLGMAAAQSAAATLNPPHLAAMFVTEGPSDYYSCSMRHDTALYLHAGGELSVHAPEVRFAATTYRFDPRDPVPTLGGNISVGFEGYARRRLRPARRRLTAHQST